MEKKDDKGIVSSKQPNVYVNLIDFLADNGFMENKSEIVRTAIDRKLKNVCKVKMESDKVFDKPIEGMKIVSYHLRKDQIFAIETLVRLGMYSARSDFIRDAIGEYFIDEKILTKILKERENSLKNQDIKIPITYKGEEKIICINEHGCYFAKPKDL